MASPIHWPNAFAVDGPLVALLEENYFSGNVRFVSSTHPAASDANSGLEPELPKATWTSAYGAAAAQDVIVVAANHAETISAGATLNKAGLMTLGLGSGSSVPRFTSAVAGVMWTLDAADIRFVNCYFPASTAATTARISTTAGCTDAWLQALNFECGVNDTTTTLLLQNYVNVRSCTFTATASRPGRAIRVTSAGDGVRMDDVLVDGGSYGWANAAISLEAACTGMHWENVRLANFSDIVATTTGCTYRFFGVRGIDSTPCRINIAA